MEANLNIVSRGIKTKEMRATAIMTQGTFEIDEPNVECLDRVETPNTANFNTSPPHESEKSISLSQ